MIVAQKYLVDTRFTTVPDAPICVAKIMTSMVSYLSHTLIYSVTKIKLAYCSLATALYPISVR